MTSRNIQPVKIKGYNNVIQSTYSKIYYLYYINLRGC